MNRWPAFLVLSLFAFLVGYYLFLTREQYLVWREDNFAKHFLPPFRSYWYLFSYHAVRFLMYYGLALAVGLGTFFLARRANRKFNERFFEIEEPWLAWLAIFMLGNRDWFSGWAWILYLFLVFGVYLVLHLFFLARSAFRNRRLSDTPRAPLYWLWMTMAALTIIIAEFANIN